MNQLIRDRLLLNMIPGVGPRMYQKLLERFGDAGNALMASEQELRSVSGLGAKLAGTILDAKLHLDVTQELEDCERYEVKIFTLEDPEYPAELKQIADPPPILYCKGELRETDRLAIGVVGSRHLSDYGAKTANQFGRGLAQCGFTIVSGLARGADAAAHKAALSAGGRTIAVLGSGILNMYPPEHKDLAAEISVNGAVISEMPLHRPPHAGAFPQRNRIVSGLSLGVLVVEASSRSGALITARHAMEQGREVFAIPGRIDSRTSQGCNDLIRDGAKLVQSIDDILEELGPLTQPVTRVVKPEIGRADTTAEVVTTIRQPAELQLNDQEQAILQAISVEPTLVDLIVQKTGLPVSRVLATLSVLQARRLIRRISGNQVARV